MAVTWQSIGIPRTLLVPAILALSLSQCAPLTPYHTEPGLSVAGHAEKYPIDMPTDEAMKGSVPEFSLGKVEFDDQGELWNANQLSYVVDEIKDKSRGKPLLLIVFTHGWNNSADPNSGNFKDFETTLAGMARSFSEPSGDAPARRIFGVYMGWRGRAIRGITAVGDFWSRMSAAHRVGGGAAVTESLYAVTSAAKRANPKSKVIVIGHSFGGIVMENAVSKGFSAQVGASAGHGATLHPVADVVLLINPAERSTYSRQLVTTFKRRAVRFDRRGPGGTRVPMPMLVSITSESDLATRLAFPAGVGIGRAIGTGIVSGQVRDGEGETSYADPALEGTQSYALRHTPGHNQYLWSHQTQIIPYADPGSAPLLPGQIWEQNRHPSYNPADGSITFRTTQGRLVVLPHAGFNDTPYWVFRIDKKLVKNHTDFWKKNLMAMAVSMASMQDGLQLPAGKTLGPDRNAKPRVMK